MRRLFCGLAPPWPVRERLLDLAATLDRPGMRPTPPENLHLTLRFFGSLDAQQEEQALAAVEDAVDAHIAPIAIDVAGVSAFPSEARPRAIFAGVRQAPALHALHASIEQRTRRAGLPADPRRFRPHVTLARCGRPRTDDVMAFLTDAALFEAPRWAVDEVIVWQSVLRPDGSRYAPIARFSLRTGALPLASTAKAP